MGTKIALYNFVSPKICNKFLIDWQKNFFTDFKTNKINISDSANFGLVEGSADMVGGLIASLTHSTSLTNDYNIYQGFNYGTVKVQLMLAVLLVLAVLNLFNAELEKIAKFIN